MSDFLDRLASRAIGREPMLEPRLPSLFEPAQHAPLISPKADETGVRESRREADSATVGETFAPRANPAPAAQPAATEPVRRMAPRRDAAPSAPQASGDPSPAAARAVAIAPTRSPVETDVHPQPTAATSLPLSHVVPAPVQPRGRHVVPSPPDVAQPSPAAVGVLLPSRPSGIASSRASDPGENGQRASATRAGHAAADAARHLPSEPVVHVSIGRIEVRAAPAVTAAPRARDVARPSSLDDYLRQRNGKAPS